MIRSAVTISLVPEVRGGPFVFWDDLAIACHKAKQLGFDAIEVFPPAADAVDATLLRRLLDETGLQLAAVGTGAGWVRRRLTLTSGDAGVRQQARAFIQAIIDLAGPFGAPAIIGSMQGRFGDGVDRKTALAHLAEALVPLATHARRYNANLLIEPLNRYETNLLNTVEDGVRLVSALASDNLKLLADLFHMNIEEANPEAALRAGKDRIGHVHFVDSNRRPAGQGHIDFAPLAKALQETGYDGYLSAEALPLPDPDAAARQTIESFRKYFPR
jgi:sugar phosphate isomerase/epimerase